MYESPITLLEKQISMDIEKTIEGEIWKATKEIGVVVDRQELIRALEYDRDQYYKGYQDATEKYKDKWISLKDKIQELRETVLITTFNLVTIGWRNSEDYEKLQFSIIDPVNNRVTKADPYDYHITHWMPLPKPYKGE